MVARRVVVAKRVFGPTISGTSILEHLLRNPGLGSAAKSSRIRTVRLGGSLRLTMA